MRKGWEYKKLGDCTQILDSQRKPVTKRDRKSGIYPYYGATGIQDYVDKYIFDGRYVLVGEDGAKWSSFTQSAFIIEGKTWVNNHAHVLRTNDFLVDSFLVYFLNYSDLDSYISGAIIRKLTQASLRNIDIPLPPKSTQLAIVSELDKINELIRLKKEQLKDFDNLAQSLFYEMFGEGKCLRKKLKDIVKIQSGQVSPLEEPYSEMIHVGPANIESNTGRLLNLKTAKEENLISGKYLFNSSMVLYSKIRPNLNKVTIPSFEGICSADMYPIIPLECIDKNFLLFLLKQKEFLTYAISNSGRANIPKINREALLNYEAILPPLSLQRLFAQRIEQIEREKSEVQKSIQDLETLLASRMQYWFE